MPQGEQLTVEILLNSPIFDRIVLPFKANAREARREGVSIRIVDSAQYQRRTDSFDYDVIVDVFAQSESPGNEQRDFWGSASAGVEGSRNAIGIKNPAIDKLVEKVVFAKDRDDLIAATRALDRVLLWNHYVVPHWHSPASASPTGTCSRGRRSCRRRRRHRVLHDLVVRCREGREAQGPASGDSDG